MKIIEPSLLAFDLNRLDEQLKEVKQAGAQYIHYDVMDGIFVNNKAFGPQQLININQQGMKANVHMMVQDPMLWIKQFIDFPMNSLTFHPEVYNETQVLETFSFLHQHHIKCGLALKVHVDANQYKGLLAKSDYVCIMSVEPGKGGQSFMEESINNLNKVKQIKEQINPNLIIQLDGGVNTDVMKKTSQYVDHFVTGSFLMKQDNKSAIFNFVKEL
ncbi:MAG: ribulose-phosphate 3-epimerase [Mycoplasmataceae bacterium]|nr:ribulose-phosphate 3-epimerase [Mycoplasmataceae bacterium]